MPLIEFWNDEEELLHAYIKAYYEDVRYTSWLNGYYMYVAQLTATSNTWGGDKGKDVSYPDYHQENEIPHVDIKEKPKGPNDNNFLAQFY